MVLVDEVAVACLGTAWADVHTRRMSADEMMYTIMIHELHAAI